MRTSVPLAPGLLQRWSLTWSWSKLPASIQVPRTCPLAARQPGSQVPVRGPNRVPAVASSSLEPPRWPGTSGSSGQRSVLGGARRAPAAPENQRKIRAVVGLETCFAGNFWQYLGTYAARKSNALLAGAQLQGCQAVRTSKAKHPHSSIWTCL